MIVNMGEEDVDLDKVYAEKLAIEAAKKKAEEKANKKAQTQADKAAAKVAAALSKQEKKDAKEKKQNDKLLNPKEGNHKEDHGGKKGNGSGIGKKANDEKTQNDVDSKDGQEETQSKRDYVFIGIALVAASVFIYVKYR